MRRCKTITWILILSIMNVALGAPAAVREGLEMSVDVDVAEGGTATSQKRYDPLDDWSTTNAADRPPTPPNLSPSELDRLWEEVAEQGINEYDPPTPESPGSSESVDSAWPNYEPLNPGSPAGTDSTGTLSSTGHQPTPPQSPTGGPPHPGPSKDRFPSPPGFSVNPDTLSSTGNQPTPPQSPTGESPLPPPPHPEQSGSPDEFLEDLLKGKIKRRISGSSTVDSAAQRDPRSTDISTCLSPSA